MTERVESRRDAGNREEALPGLRAGWGGAGRASGGWAWPTGAVAVLLLVMLPWWRLLHAPLILLDDPDYVMFNPVVRGGISAETVRAAFGIHMGLWIPLTWLSLALDVTMWGKHAVMGMHAMNVALHVANALLVCFLLRLATGKAGRSLLVALLFAMHPLRTESVAWVTERKDVLSGFFGLLALMAYVYYARAKKNRAGVWWYVGACVLFGMSLLAKPALVFLPLVLLLVDVWPLGRWPAQGGRRRMGWLVLEKMPLVAIAAGASAVTLLGTTGARAAYEALGLTFFQRIGNAALGYLLTLRDMVYFQRLAVYYPLQPAHAGEAVIACLVLALVTVAAAWAAWRWPARGGPALVGWVWFVLLLLPASGVLQTGMQARADRFTYFSSIGLMMGLVWIWPEGGRGRWPGAMVGAVCVLVLTISTDLQVRLWMDPLQLYLDGIAHTGANPVLNFTVGQTLQQEGNLDGAVTYYGRAVGESSHYPEAENNLGAVLLELHRPAEALPHLQRACELVPGEAVYRRNYEAGVRMMMGAGP